MKNNNFIYWASNFTYIIQGMVTTSMGLLLPHMMLNYSIDYAQGGSMIFFLLIGGVISSTYGGMLISRTGEKALVILGALFIIAGYTATIFASNIIVVYILFFIVGTGTGFFNIALNTLVAGVSGSSPKKISILHMFFAVGALLMTLLAAAINNFNLSWKVYLYVVILLSAISIALFSKINVETSAKKKENHKIDWSFLKKPDLYVFITLLFFYVGSETAVNGWIVTFLNDSKIISEGSSSYVLSILWGLVIIGRFANQKLNENISMETRTIVCAFVILVSYIALITTTAAAGVVLSVVVLGLAMSAFFPNAVANAAERLSDNASALGLLLSFGGLGGSVIPWLNGVIADSYGISVSMKAIIVSILLLFIAAIINVLLKKTKEKNSVSS